MQTDRTTFAAVRSLALAAAITLSAVSPALAATSYRSVAPPRVDPFTGIVDRKVLTEKIAPPLAGANDLNVAVILSENTKNQIAWSNEVMAGMKGADRTFGTLISGGGAVATYDHMLALAYDPKFITDSVMQPLVGRFKSVKIVGDLAQFSQGGYDLAVVLDVSFVNVFYYSPVLIGDKFETGTTVNAYFIDRGGALIEKVEASQSRAIPQADFVKTVAEVRADILARYRTGLDAVLAPEAAQTQTVPPAPAASAIADRLKALDDLLKSGLITREEAAQKRAKIIDGL